VQYVPPWTPTTILVVMEKSNMCLLFYALAKRDLRLNLGRKSVLGKCIVKWCFETFFMFILEISVLFLIVCSFKF